jgi:hypothetical protein
MKEIKQNSFSENTETFWHKESQFYWQKQAIEEELKNRKLTLIILIFINFGFLFSFIMVFLKG